MVMVKPLTLCLAYMNTWFSMNIINSVMTIELVRLPDKRMSDVDFIADRDNSGVITITLHDNPNTIVDKLAAGDSFTRATGFDLQELDAKSTVPDDILIIRW